MDRWDLFPNGSAYQRILPLAEQGVGIYQDDPAVLAVFPQILPGNRSSEHVSLDRFMDKYKGAVGKPFVIHSKDLRSTDDAIYVPIYMTSLL